MKKILFGTIAVLLLGLLWPMMSMKDIRSAKHSTSVANLAISVVPFYNKHNRSPKDKTELITWFVSQRGSEPHQEILDLYESDQFIYIPPSGKPSMAKVKVVEYTTKDGAYMGYASGSVDFKSL